MTALELIPRLTPQQKVFAEHYAQTADKRASVIAAWPSYNRKTGPQQTDKANRELADPHVKAHLAHVQAQATEHAINGAAAVFKRWADIVMADPGELVQFRRNCCRYCYGKDHAYQWVTKHEWAIKYAEVVDANRLLDDAPHKQKPLPTFDGGGGFDPQRPVFAQCPVCAGEGVETVWMADTRTLSPSARLLYLGAEMTRNGVKINMTDQAKALENIARTLAMFQEKIILHTPEGAGGVPASIPSDPIAASNAYMAIIKGKSK